jgi:hypothetical protein
VSEECDVRAHQEIEERAVAAKREYWVGDVEEGENTQACSQHTGEEKIAS